MDQRIETAVNAALDVLIEANKQGYNPYRYHRQDQFDFRSIVEETDDDKIQGSVQSSVLEPQLSEKLES